MLTSTIIDQMYRLYADHYLDASKAMFLRDLAGKTHTLLLSDALGELCGFSTMQLYRSVTTNGPVRVVYSGDTIVDPKQWGSPALAIEWLRFAGEIERREPAIPLYWFLIVKGHRTYRFLPTFARQYIPHHAERETPVERQILAFLATEKFGSNYDARTGLIRFETPQGRLNRVLAEVPERHARLPSVRHFLQLNPGYHEGDELACLCRLSLENLRPMAARAFVGTTGFAH